MSVSGNPPPRPTKPKGKPIQRTAKQQAAVTRAAAQADLADQRTKAEADAAQLAQIVNLVIAGHSYETIGASIGASADEVERMVTTGADRYVRTQPSLRAYVRNLISGYYMKMLDADIDIATDKNHAEKLEHQDRVMRMLPHLADLHGAKAPTQSEVKVQHSADEVEALVNRLARAQGQGYDINVFDEDVVDAEIVHDAAASSLAALEAASAEVEILQPEDGDGVLRS